MHDPSVNRLETLYKVSQALASTLDLDELLNLVIDQIIAVTGAERGFLMLGETGESLTFRVARGIDQRAIEAPEFEVSRGVIDRVAGEVQAVVTSDAQTEEWLSSRESVTALGLRSIMCVPLQVQSKMIGLVYVDNRMRAGIFTPPDLDLLQAVSNTASVAIENARLHELAIEQARLERELEVARQVQASLIPTKAPELPGFEIKGLWRSAREVAGDFYDFIPRTNGELGVVIGDVTDKGVPAAFFMAVARTTIRASVASDLPVSECFEQANRLIYADSSTGMFVTLFYAGLEAGTDRVTCLSAGHNPPLLVRANAKGVETLPIGGLPLGVDEDGQFSEFQIELAGGDLLLMYTDGVVDAIDDKGEFFGLDRLTNILQKGRGRSATEIVEAVEKSVAKFVAGQQPFDDLTMVAIRHAD